MTRDAIDPIAPIDTSLADLLSADRDVPAVDDTVRARLSDRLSASRRIAPWRTPAEVPTDELASRRSRVSRRAMLGGVLAVAAAAAAAMFTFGGRDATQTGDSASPTTVPGAARPTAVEGPGRRGGFEVRLVDHDSAYMHAVADTLAAEPMGEERLVRVERDNWLTDDGTRFDDLYLFSADVERGDGILLTFVNDLAARYPNLAVPSDRVVMVEAVEGDEPGWRTYVLHREIAVAGTRVELANVMFNPQTNQPEVLVHFDDKGARQFHDLTRDNVGRKLAIIVDGELLMAPVVQAPITEGRVTITLGAVDATTMLRQAEDLVHKIRGTE